MLHLDIPRDLALPYQTECCQPRSRVTSQSNGTPFRNLSQPIQFSVRGITSWQRVQTQSAEAGSSSSIPDPKNASQPSQNTAIQPTVYLREIYWCVRKAWSDRQVTRFCSLKVGSLSEREITDDKSLCVSLLAHVENMSAQWN
jgi:hypothetical protein